jgi:hypothetical protein
MASERVDRALVSPSTPFPSSTKEGMSCILSKEMASGRVDRALKEGMSCGLSKEMASGRVDRALKEGMSCVLSKEMASGRVDRALVSPSTPFPSSAKEGILEI